VLQSACKFLTVLNFFRTPPRPTRFFILVALAAVGLIVLCFLPPMPLQSNYHEFADRRRYVNIPNTLDVLSNVVFLFAGALGVLFLLRTGSMRSFREKRERVPYLIFFLSVALTACGSAYYHLAPGDSRLVWDLLPMTFSFVSLLAASIVERISIRVGLGLLAPLLVLGAVSVLYWYRGALVGHGDIRFYLFVQFFSPLLIGAVVVLFASNYTGSRDLGIAFLLYLLAKLLELLDRNIFSAGALLSGHTLKHLVAGLACYWILRMLRTRRVLECPFPISPAAPLPVQ
jgi:hypothetical protein